MTDPRALNFGLSYLNNWFLYVDHIKLQNEQNQGVLTMTGILNGDRILLILEKLKTERRRLCLTGN